MIAVTCAFGARAVEWSGTVTLTEDVAEAVTLDGEVEVTVAKESTVTINGAISDKAGTKGRIKLLGGGTLVLATANTFTGGAYVDAGVLQVTCANALGTGKITVKGTKKAKSKLQFNFSAIKSQGTITYANNIVIENSGSESMNYCQLHFGPHNTEGANTNRQTLKLTGDITCAGDLYMTLNNTWQNAGEPNLYLNNVTVGGKFYIDRPSIDVFIQGKLVAKDFCCGNQGGYLARLYSADNRIDRISYNNGGLQCMGRNVLGGAVMAYAYQRAVDTALKMNSYSQTVAALSTEGYDDEAKKAHLPQITATAAVTLTLTGGVEQATYEGSIGASIALTVDPKEGSPFEQVLTGDLSAMDSRISVNRGKLTLADAATIPTDGVLDFALGANGMIDLGGRTYVAKAITIDGVEQKNTTLTHATHPNNIAEDTVITVGGSGDQTIETDMTKDGDWEAFVGEGLTWTVTAQQTGSGKIVKKGTGTLVLTAANTFTGGVQIDAGTVTVGKNGALGGGDVTIAGSTANDCQLRFDTVLIGEASTVANRITLVGDSSEAHQAIYFAFPTETQTDVWTVTFTGGITATGNLYFGDNHGGKTSKSTGADWSAKNWVTFDCAIDASGKTVGIAPLGYTPGCTVYFNGPVKAKTFSFRGYTADSTGGAGNLRFNAANEIGTMSCAYNHVYATVDGALGDAMIDIVDSYSSTRTFFYLGKGTTQRVKSLKTVKSSAGKDMTVTTSSGTATLVIDGSSADSATAQFSLQGGLSLLIDAQDDDFTQTLKNRTHAMTGSIAVKRGKLVIDGASDFTGTPTLAVSNGAVFKVEAESVGILSNKLSLAIETGAVLDLPSDAFLVKTLTVDGRSYRNGAYTKAEIPALPEGLTLTVTAGSVTMEADWTGAAGEENRSTATMANWTVDGVVPTADDLSLADGSLVATLIGGTGMTYGDGDFLNCITNAIAVDADMKPFVLAPATPDATLRIRNGVESDQKAQMVLRGHIAPPLDTGVGARIYYYALDMTSLPEGTITSKYKAGKAIPLVLDGVTLDLPLSLEIGDNANSMIARPNTTNDLNGSVNTLNYSAYFSADEGSVIRFNGGFRTASAYHFYGPGEFQFNAGSVKFADGMEIQNEAKVVLDADGIDVTGNKNREGFVLTSGSLEFRRSNCLVETAQLAFKPDTTSAFALEFNQTTQRVGRANFDAATKGNKATLNGTYPAMLEITGATRSGASAAYLMDPLCSAQVTGGLGFHMMWVEQTLVMTNRAFASCGNLEVSAGALELSAGATWLNGTNFVARGTGTLKFGGSRQVDKRFAVLTIDDEGKVEVADGKTLKVAECRVNGLKVATGEYSAADLQKDDPLYGHLTGGGILRVGKFGGVLQVR